MRKLIPLNSLVLSAPLVFAPLVLLAASLCGAPMMTAQTPASALPSTSATPAHKPAHPHKRPVAATKAQPAAPQPASQPAALPAVPTTTEAIVWPANEKPTEATVTWDSQGLRIKAANSSLEQILNDVSTATGAKVAGFESDQRIFGNYGPGQARDVLSQLLQGSGYNVLMIGDQGQGTPREIVLSLRHSGSSSPAANPAQASDDDAEVDEPQPQPQPIRAPFGFNGARNPQQAEEQRQQQMQQRQQQQPQPQPPNNPQN